MKTTWIPPVILKIIGVKNIAGDQVNPATEETAQAIAAKKIGDSFWLKNVLSAITRLTVNTAGELRVVVGSIGTLTTLTTLTTMTTGNISLGDSGKTATIITQTNANFQAGGRRLFRKV